MLSDAGRDDSSAMFPRLLAQSRLFEAECKFTARTATLTSLQIPFRCQDYSPGGGQETKQDS